MLNQLDPDKFLVAISNILNELPQLIGGEEWEKIGHKLLINFNQLNDSIEDLERKRSVVNIIETLASFPKARIRLREEIDIISTIRDDVFMDLTSIVTQFNFDSQSIQPSLNLVQKSISVNSSQLDHTKGNTRKIILKHGRHDSGKSIKFKNFHIDFGKIVEMIGGLVMTGSDMLSQPHPLVISAGLMLIIRSLTNTLTVELSEKEVSVLWGLIAACDKNNKASESKIITQTNIKRKNFGLQKLNKKEIINALNKLQTIKCVQTIPGKSTFWRLIESYEIRN